MIDFFAHSTPYLQWVNFYCSSDKGCKFDEMNIAAWSRVSPLGINQWTVGRGAISD
jgi:hypothetical protein